MENTIEIANKMMEVLYGTVGTFTDCSEDWEGIEGKAILS